MRDTAFGKYRFIAELGHGGMADVFLAVLAGPLGSGFSKLTVIKRLRQNLAEEPEFVAMLVDEARIAARLNHPNVVQTNEVGQVSNQYFLAMEYLDGQPLHRVQHRANTAHAKANGAPKAHPFPPELQYLVLLDALAGLHHAHELADYDGTPLEIVHRDVTPQNIFVTYEGQAKVVDFGIAKAIGRASETRQGVVKGKVRYMAPEQAIGREVDRRADLFSIGIMLWEAATSRRMWKDLDDLQILQRLVKGEIPSSPKEIDPGIADAIDKMCRKALALHPEDRYQTAEEFRTELEQFMAESHQLVDCRRALGPALAELFKDKRQEIRAVIEKQLAVLSTKPSSDFELAPAPESLSHSSSTSQSMLQTVTSPPTGSAMGMPVDGRTMEGTTSTLLNAPVDYAPRRKRGLRFGVAAVATTIVVGAVLLVRLGGLRSARVEAAPPPTQAATDQKPDNVSIRLSATPPNATITLDGRQVPNRYDATVARDTKDHFVSVEAAGFERRNEKVQFTSDVTMVFDLVKSPSAPPPPQQQASAAAANPRKPTAAAWRPPPSAPATKPAAADAPTAATAHNDTPPKNEPTGPAGRHKLEMDNGDPWAPKPNPNP
jgi:eukaryotic-like serine/threonine-protein kinase